MSQPARPSPAGARAAPSIAAVMGRRILSHASLYAFAGSLGFLSVLAQIVILTRLLPQGEYGDLAILLLYSGFAAVLAGLAVAQGTTVSAFIGGDEEGMVEETSKQTEATDNRGILATGLQLTLMNCVWLTGLAYVIGNPLSELLTGEPGARDAVVFATVFGALAPAWRLVGAIPRFERRPRVYVAMQVANHSASLAAAAGLAAAGYGIAGAMAGLAAGRALVLLLGIVLSRHRFRRTFRRDHARTVFKRGWPYAGVIAAFFLSRNAELFVLAQYGTGEDVGTYQVASRLAMVPGFAMSATLMAWGPIVRGPIRAALENQEKLSLAKGRMVTYYIMLAIWMIVTGVLLGEVLVQIAPDEYASAARLLPLLLVAATLHAGTMLVFRMSMIKGGIKRLRNWALTSVVLLVGGSFLLVPTYGTLGAAVINALVPAIGVTVIYISSRQGRDPLQLRGRQIAGILLIAVACAGAGVLATLLPGPARIPVELALVAAFPLLLLTTGIFPRNELWQLVRLLRPSTGNKLRKSEVRARLCGRPAADVELLEAVVRCEDDPHVLAERFELSERELCERLVAVLRDLSETGKPGKADAKIGANLLIRTAQTKRDLRAYQLSQDPDVDPLELDRLAHVMLDLRGLRPRAWEAARRAAPPESAAEPVSAQ